VQGIGLGLDERAAQAIRAAGNSCRRRMLDGAPFQRGSPSKQSSGCSRQLFVCGVAFSPCLTISPKTNMSWIRWLPLPEEAARHVKLRESTLWTRRFLPRGRPAPFPRFLLPRYSELLQH